MYQIPEEYFYPLHHIRPRFKGDVESVLLFMATQIARLEPADPETFKSKLNDAIRLYPENAGKEQKTIDNWRTEISALFGLLEYGEEIVKPGRMAILLAEHQDLIEFFRYFLYYFQYPGGHLKAQETAALINKGIRFKPARYLIELFFEGAKLVKEGERFGITKAEAAHCIFNDLRVTRDGRPPIETAKLILANRLAAIKYDEDGDIVRYAGDILDYLELADLTKLRPNYQYYVNASQLNTLQAFVDGQSFFAPYEVLYGKGNITAADVAKTQAAWFTYVNSTLNSSIFEADVLSLIEEIGEEKGQSVFIQQVLSRIRQSREAQEALKAKEVGDIGEAIIIEHEKTRLLGKPDLVRNVKKIPEQFAVGYDISSFEGEGELRRYIEVKTTVSRGKLASRNFHMTPSEWSAASSSREIYFVYRLMISGENLSLFLIQDPVGKYKQDLLGMVPRDGADITYSDKSGHYADLLV